MRQNFVQKVYLLFLISNFDLRKHVAAASNLVVKDWNDLNINHTKIRSCCSYQSKFLNGSCRNLVEDSHKKFPEVLNVTTGSDTFEISIQVNTENRFNCLNGTFVTQLSSYRNSLSRFTACGYVVVDQHFYSPTSFCLNSVDEDAISMEIVVCNPVCNNDTLCIPLCSESPLKNVDLYVSKPKSNSTQNLNDLISTESNILDIGSAELLHFFVSRPDCISEGREFRTQYYSDFKDIANNSLFGAEETAAKFCIQSISDNVDGKETSSVSLLTCGNEWPYDEFGLSATEIPLYGICSVISFCFLILAIVIYLLLSKRQTVHSWTQFCYVLSLSVLYVSIITAIYIPTDRNNLCTVRYFINVFVYHLCCQQIITWLALLSFDLFLSFWRLKPSVGHNRQSLRKFYIYAAIGWIAPISIYGINFLLQRREWELAGYCIQFYDQRLTALYGLLAVAINIGFFSATFFQILKHRKNAQFASQNASKQQNHLISLFFKLFLITGITFAGVVVEIATKSARNRSSIPLFVFRAFICLQGLVVFIVYLCNKKTWNQLLQRFPNLKNLSITSIRSIVTQSTKDSSTEMREQQS